MDNIDHIPRAARIAAHTPSSRDGPVVRVIAIAGGIVLLLLAVWAALAFLIR